VISRRSFLGALAGLVAAPSLIEKLKPVPRRDAFEAYYTSYTSIVTLDRKTLDKVTPGEQAFVKWAEAALEQSANRHMWELHRMYGA